MIRNINIRASTDRVHCSVTELHLPDIDISSLFQESKVGIECKFSKNKYRACIFQQVQFPSEEGKTIGCLPPCGYVIGRLERIKSEW